MPHPCTNAPSVPQSLQGYLYPLGGDAKAFVLQNLSTIHRARIAYLRAQAKESRVIGLLACVPFLKLSSKRAKARAVVENVTNLCFDNILSTVSPFTDPVHAQGAAAVWDNVDVGSQTAERAAQRLGSFNPIPLHLDIMDMAGIAYGSTKRSRGDAKHALKMLGLKP